MKKNNINPFWAAMSVSLAAFMEVLDTTIANVALTHIAGGLGASINEGSWIITSYLITNAIVLPISGWLSHIFSRKKFFIFCILGFTCTSFLCGIAATLPALIFFRLLQGLTGGGLQPTQQAIIKDSFPPEKLGMAFAITGIATVLAPILGPAVGGYITDTYSWRWIFFINVPIGFLASILVKKFVYDSENKIEKEKFNVDFIGLIFVALALGTLQIVLDNGQQYDWFDNNIILVLSIISFSCMIAMLLWFLNQNEPMINLRLFSIPSFCVSCIMTFFIGAFINVTIMLFPMLVQNNFGYSASLAGLVLVPGGVVILLCLPIVGKLSNIIQAKYLISLGMFLTGISMLSATLITSTTDIFTFILLRILQTIGIPFMLVPIATLTFLRISKKNSNNASSLAVLMKTIGGSIGISLSTNYLIHHQQIEQIHLINHIENGWGYNNLMYLYEKTFMNLNIINPQYTFKASIAMMYHVIQSQASILAYIDLFRILSYMFFLLSIISLFMPKNIFHKNSLNSR